MVFSVTRSRAAVLCLGGWGLQVMLHLWPRLRFVQEERWALGLEHQLPDLNRVTAFAAIVPEPTVWSEEEYQPVRVVRPHPEHYPGPFYVEQQLDRIQVPETEGPYQHLTEAERITAQLLDRALRDEYLLPLTIASPPPVDWGSLDGRVSRSAMFSMAIRWAESAVRPIIRHVIDPTRLDSVQTRDPFVQTNIYVVASLAEPLTSVLVWPFVSELVAQLGNRNLAKVVAILATGSFAQDETRAIEEAATYAALVELEALTGIRENDVVLQALRERVRHHGRFRWEQRVGRKLFDRIYLVDREKSNQALARDSQELAVLAGNAIEAFLVADGASYVEKHLVPDLDMHRSLAYSLLGAANDYVPLAQYVVAAVEEEQKRIVRETILTAGGGEPVRASLRDLGATPEEAIKSLMDAGTTPMFEEESARVRALRPVRRSLVAPVVRALQNVRRRRAAGALTALQLAKAYIFPEHVLEHLHRVRFPWQWRTLVDVRISDVMGHMEAELNTVRFERAWGLTSYYPGGDEDDLAAVLNGYREKTWVMRRQGDPRPLPAAVFRALRYLVEDICRRPAGIVVARERVARWLEEVDAVLDELVAEEFPDAASEWSGDYERDVHRWSRDFIAAYAGVPHMAAVLARSALLFLFMSFLVISWLSTKASLSLTFWQQLAVVVGGLLVAVLLSSAVLAARQGCVRRLQERRMRMEQRRLSLIAHYMVRDGLYRLYRRLRDELGLLESTLQETMDSLERWAQPEEPVQVPPTGLDAVHLRVTHTDARIWEAIRDLVQGEFVDGMTSQEAFHHSWEGDGRVLHDWQEQGEHLAQRVRLALELPLNREELEHVIELERRWRRQQRERFQGDGTELPQDAPGIPAEVFRDPAEDLRAHLWCGYASRAPHERGAFGCTACPDPRECPFRSWERRPYMGWSLLGIIRDYVERATAHLLPRNQVIPGKPSFVRQIVDEYALERLLLERGRSSSLDSRDDIHRDFMEDIYARAKPAGNYDVKDAFASMALTVEFGVTAYGQRSMLQRAFARRGVPLLASQDPMSISVIRTVNGLALEDLRLSERCAMAYRRLHERDRALLTLFPEDKGAVRALYGEEEEEVIIHSPLMV